MIDYPKIFIIILNWNKLQDTLECLESVFRLDYPNFEVIVVDNASTDNSAKVIHKMYPQIALIENYENMGFTGGNNIGMHHAIKTGADYIWLLNNDTVVERDTLSKLLAIAEKSPDVGLISPVIYYYDEPHRIQFCGHYVEGLNPLTVFSANEDQSLYLYGDFKIRKNVYLWGTALLIKKAVIEKIGYLDETFFAYWEDTDYSIRVLKAGYRNLVCASAKIYHKVPFSAAIKRGPHYFYYMTRNRYFFIIKHFKNLGRLSILKDYLSYILTTATSCNHIGDNESTNACLDGAWAALHGISGSWDKTLKMPGWLRKIFYTLFSWHPYFLASLLRGEFSKVAHKGFRRIKAVFKNREYIF